MRHEVERSIDPTHPALAGHFPGNPIIPGVVILNELLCVAENCLHWRPGPLAIPSVKFMHPLRPSDPFTLVLERRSENQLSFSVLQEGTTIAAGILERAGSVTEVDQS